MELPARLRRLASLASLVLLLAWGAAGEKVGDVHPSGYVTDLAGVIEPATKQKLEALCAEVEQKTGAQIAVVTVRSLEGESKEEYSVRLFQHLGVGHKQDERGVLLLLATGDRQYRIEVGYGLEPVITDGRAGDIGRAMVPRLRQGDYSGAVQQAVGSAAQLIAADRGVTLQAAPAPPPAPAQPGSDDDSGNQFWPLLALALIWIGVSRILAIAGRRGRRGGGFWWGGPMGGWGGGFGGSSGGFSGGGGFGGFGGGLSGGGGAGGSW